MRGVTLREATEILAASPESQEEYLSVMGLSSLPEELILQFLDLFPLVQMRAGETDKSWVESMDLLKKSIDDMGGPESDAWLPQAQFSHPDWRSVRISAGKALDFWPNGLDI